MNRVTVTLPDDIYAQLQNMAKSEGVSVGQYVTYAIAKQVEQVNTGPSTELSTHSHSPTINTEGSSPILVDDKNAFAVSSAPDAAY